MVSLWQQVEQNKNHGQSDFLWQKLQPLGKQFRGRWTALTIKKFVSSLKFIQAVQMVKQTLQFWQNSQNSKCGVGDLGMRRWQCGLGILAKWSWQTLKVNNVANSQMAIWTLRFGKVALKIEQVSLAKQWSKQTVLHINIVRPVQSSFHTSCTPLVAHFYKVNQEQPWGI